MSTGRLAAPFRWFQAMGWPGRAAVLLSAAVVLPVAFVVAVYFLPPSTAVALGKPVLALLRDRPPLPEDLEPVTERSVLLDNEGEELATLFEDVNRVRIELDDVADVALDALLASEDEHFYDHPGIDHRAVIRAAVANLRAGDVEQGGSTLTQQLVKNVYLEPARTFRRKLTEAWYALQLEDRLTKDEILQRYLNEAYFGHGAYGIEAAAQLYFATTAKDLQPHQAALLVGVIPSPSSLNPIDAPEQAREARDRVLERMAETGRLSDAAANEAKQKDLELDVTPPPPPDEPFFVAYVRHALLHDPVFEDALGEDPAAREDLLYGGGLTVHTTLNRSLQSAANEAIADVMGDPEGSPLVSAVSVEPGTGAVRAMAVGPHEFGRCEGDGDGCGRTMVNPTAPGLGGSGRQPGSAFKPFVLTAALAADVPPGWQQRTADGKPIDGCDDGGEPYEPSNYSEDPGIKAMPEAIRVSNNVYHAKLAGLLGPELLVEAAEAAGLRSGELPKECSVALGSGSAYPLEMSVAYATFASEGERCDAFAVRRIETGATAGGETFEYEPRCDEVVDTAVARRINTLLQEPVEDGTATTAQIGRPVAGKTGTTDDYKDAWFIGYIPQLVTSVWLGYEEPRALEDVRGVDQVTGGSLPAQVWATYMQAIEDRFDEAQFARPEDPDPVEVPDFRKRDADEVLEEFSDDYTFNIETRRARDYREEGTVIRQRPKQGNRVDPGRLVTLFVSNGKGDPPEVPDVVGMRERRARETLRDADYEVEVEEETRTLDADEDPPEEPGTVIEQRPEAGAPLEPGEPVTIVVVRYERREPEDPQPPGRDGGDDEGEEDDGTLPTGPLSPRRGAVEFGTLNAAPEGDDTAHNGGEYVTIVTGDKRVDVSGWSIEYEGGGTLRIGVGYLMPRNSELAVHTGPGDDDPPERYFNDYDEEVLLDDGGVLVLRDRRGREVARASY